MDDDTIVAAVAMGELRLSRGRWLIGDVEVDEQFYFLWRNGRLGVCTYTNDLGEQRTLKVGKTNVATD